MGSRNPRCERPSSMKSKILLATFVLLTVCSMAQATTQSCPAPIGQPTIFWRNSQWETFQHGQWTPYRAPGSPLIRESNPGPAFGIGLGQPNVAIGQPNGGLGKPNFGIGQPNVGLGRNNFEIGRPN